MTLSALYYISDSELRINGYTLVRRDRDRHGGGVMLYIRDNLSFCVVYNGPENLELLDVKLLHGHSQLVVCVCSVCSSCFCLRRST